MTCDNNEEIPAFKALLKNYDYMNMMMINQLEFMSTHHGLTGSYREKMWLSFFRSIIPQKYSLAQGVVIIDSYGKQSKEVDIAVFDEQYTPYVFQYESLKYIPIEAVAVVISCKSNNVDIENLKSWANSIDQLQTRRVGISRTINGLITGYSNTTQIRTRPIKILATLKEHKTDRTIDDFANRYEDNYDIIILEKKMDIEELRNLKKAHNKFEVRVNHADWTLDQWFFELNQFKNKKQKKACIKLSKEIWDEIQKTESKILKLNSDSAEGNNIIATIENKLKDLEIEGYPLLTLNLQLNQLLMLINNPMLFPHYAYAERLREVARRGTKDE